MNLTFVFWITAVYTVVLFGLQMVELLTGQAPFNFAALNAGYLGLMSAYVGGKEVHRWTQSGRADRASAALPLPNASVQPFRLPGEWFVGGWVLLFLGASLLVQFWPARFTYPMGLNTIALEVLSFYLGSSVSRWLKVRDTETRAQLENTLTHVSSATAAPEMERRVSKKRQRCEAKIQEAVRKKNSVTREDVEKLTALKESAAGALLAGMVERGELKRIGEIGSKEARYESADSPPVSHPAGDASPADRHPPGS